jgi:hypothetical protein
LRTTITDDLYEYIAVIGDESVVDGHGGVIGKNEIAVGKSCARIVYRMLAGVVMALLRVKLEVMFMM